MKIVFIMNGNAPRCIKRVQEFVLNGYEVEVYGFSRNGNFFDSTNNVNPQILFNIDTTVPYHKRVLLLKKGVQKVVSKYKNEDVVYYLFQLDVALAFRMCSKSKRYIYEESDLRHTYLNVITRNVFESIDKYIIKRSLVTVFTSEGFIGFHYGNQVPSNVCVIPNRLHLDICKLDVENKTTVKGKLSVGFVGAVRYNATIKFIDYFCRRFPDYEMHVFGYIEKKMENACEKLSLFPNCKFHGSFKNPDDLPSIYSNIDVVLSTYDAEFENVRYAEPNKLYEAIYFETPIIVSKDTFLEEKVRKMNIGYAVNANKENEVVMLIKTIENSLQEKIDSCKEIDKKACLNSNKEFFNKLKDILK